MRTLLFFALIIIGAGGYLAYFNDLSVTITLYTGRQFQAPLVPLLLGAVALGLLLGLAGTLWNDLTGFFFNLGNKRRKRLAERVRALFLAAEREFLAGRTLKAKDLYRKITKLDPEHVQAISRLGDIARAKDAIKEAITLHRLAMRLDPDNPAHRLSMVDDYLAMGAHESVAQLVEPGLADDPKNQTLLIHLRTARAALKEWDAAAEVQERLMRTPMDGLVSREEKEILNGYRLEAALDLIQTGQREQGRAALIRLVRESAGFAPGHMTLAEVQMREGKAREALVTLRHGYEQTRDESFLPPIESVLIAHLEDPREALRLFSALVEREPNNARLRYYLARVYYRLEMIDDTAHVITQLEQQISVPFPELAALTARVHLRRGRVAEALRTLGEPAPPLNYACSRCGATSDGWNARCGRCGGWGHISPTLSIGGEATEPTDTILLPAPG
ncbi:MAG: tetratricopeptide repeat protein [Nitrospirae bacterium]|nr:tetratricopeptide repeat protein [Nitrospirota bacterium]